MKDFLPISNEFYRPFVRYNQDEMKLEYILRDFYSRHPEFQPDTPHTFKDNQPFFRYISGHFPAFRGISEQQLGESPAIDDQMDVAVFRHLRYLPAIVHTHEFFETVYVLDGACINYIGNREFTMKKGDVCIIAPNTEHTISAFDDNCIILNFLIRSSTFDSTFMNIFSDMNVISDFFMRTLYGNHQDFYLLFHSGDDREMLDTVEKMLKEYYASNRYRRKIINLHTAMFFMLLMRYHEKDVFIPNPRSTKSDTNFIYILHYLQTNYLTVTLKELASFFNYSERQMSRILRDYTGMNFSENIQKLRMERAASLLNSTTLSIAEIAEESGYTNVTHFRHIFKKYYGVSPVEFRSQKKE